MVIQLHCVIYGAGQRMENRQHLEPKVVEDTAVNGMTSPNVITSDCCGHFIK